MAAAIRLIVGLGNPGPQYSGTRHNAGFDLLDMVALDAATELKSEARFHGAAGQAILAGQPCRLLKPGTFMNRSGSAVAALAKYYQIEPESILVLHDELDLPAGELRLKKGGGHGGHNGLRDIIAHLGSPDFLRLRIGIDRPAKGGDVTGYVLGQPKASERQMITEAGEQIFSLLPDLVAGEIPRAMQTLHTEN